MDFNQFHAPVEDVFFVSLQEHNVRVDVVFNLLLGVHILGLLVPIPLLVLFGLIVKLIDLSKVEFLIEVIRVNESSLRVVRTIILPSIDLGAALSTASLGY